MAVILDAVEEKDEGVLFESLKEPTEDITPDNEDTSPEDEKGSDDDLPDKYKGKTAQELVRMHQEAEKHLGKQSGEVGELRQVVDDFIRTSMQDKAPKEEVEEVDFFADPSAAMAQAISTHPDIVAAKASAASNAKATALSALKAAHPDMGETLADEKFGKWVTASKLRTRLFKQANNEFNYDAADDLFNEWKERKALVAETAEAETVERKRAVKTASTGGTQGSGQRPSKKIYRRADIINLMNTDPARYTALSDEILLAYKEKRVR